MKTALFDVFGTLLAFSAWHRPLQTLASPLRLSPEDGGTLRRAPRSGSEVVLSLIHI